MENLRLRTIIDQTIDPLFIANCVAQAGNFVGCNFLSFLFCIEFFFMKKSIIQVEVIHAEGNRICSCVCKVLRVQYKHSSMARWVP